MTDHLDLLVNGETMRFPEAEFPTTVARLLAKMTLDAKAVVAEVNGDIVKRDDVSTHALRPGDTVELVNFVGGG